MKLTGETIVKIFAVLAAFCYLIGLLTVNDYLYGLGISDFSSLKPRLIYTGALVLFSIISSLTFSIIVLMEKFNYKLESFKDIKFDRINLRFFGQILVSSIVGSLISAVVYLAIFGFLYLFEPFEESFISIIFNHVIVVWFLSFIMCIYLGIILFSNASVRNNQVRFSILLFLGFFFIIGFSYYLTAFGYHVYPLIPEQFGGGKPKEVELFLKQEAIKDMKEMGIETQASADTQKITILFEGDKNYILKIKEGKNKSEIVQINKDDVRGIKLTRPPLLDK